MLDSKMILTRINVCKIRRNIVLFLAGFMVLTLAANSIVIAAGSVKAHGMLTSIEDDGTVIIDEKGYLVSPSATVQDYQGRRISLRDLLPSRFVQFEYEQTTRGFVIIFVREVPQ